MVLKEISQQAPQLNLQGHHWHADTLDLLREGAIISSKPVTSSLSKATTS